MNDRLDSWNLPWQALLRRLAVEPRFASASDAWLARTRIGSAWSAGVRVTLDLSQGRLVK